MTAFAVADERVRLTTHRDFTSTIHERFETPQNGARFATILSAGDYGSVIGTLEVLCRPSTIAALRTAITELEPGDVSSAECVRAALVAAGRLAE